MISIFDNAKIQYVLAVPDSWGSRLIHVIEKYNHCKVILCATETEAITISAGLNLSGILSIIVMENSGLRSVGDILTRFELAHCIHNIFLLSDRGGFGEANWWGVKHNCVTDNILNALSISTIDVLSFLDLEPALIAAIQTFHNEQVSVAIKLKKSFWDGLMTYDK